MTNATFIVKQLQQLPHNPKCPKERQHFLSLIYEYVQASNDEEVFARIVDYRKFEIHELANDSDNIDNLKHTFTCPTAKYVISHFPIQTLPPYYSDIEYLANTYFEHILDCWAEYLLFVIHLHAIDNVAEIDHKQQLLELDSTPYQSEIIDDISTDKRCFTTCFSNKCFSLSDANMLINIETFIKQQGWYEMLYDMETSAKGEHFILYQQVAHCVLLSCSVHIKRWRNRQSWLAFSAFFQSDKWNMKLDEKKLRSLEFFGLLDQKTGYAMRVDSIEKFDTDLIQRINQQEVMCEVIRLAIAAPARKLNYLLFTATKELMIALNSVGLRAVYIITEQPAIRYFFESVNLSYREVSPYVSLCEFKVSDETPVTEQGIYFSEPMSQAIAKCDYKAYYQKVISVRKQMK